MPRGPRLAQIMDDLPELFAERAARTPTRPSGTWLPDAAAPRRAGAPSPRSCLVPARAVLRRRARSPRHREVAHPPVGLHPSNSGIHGQIVPPRVRRGNPRSRPSPAQTERLVRPFPLMVRTCTAANLSPKTSRVPRRHTPRVSVPYSPTMSANASSCGRPGLLTAMAARRARSIAAPDAP